MTNWQQFLEQQGAQWVTEDETGGYAASFGEAPADYPGLGNTLCDLGNMGVLSVQGSDSRKFLQGQVTCDALNLAPGHSSPGAICNPKGRMLASFWLYSETDEQLLLTMDKSLINPTLASLEKYAAFFKTELRNSSDEYRQFGVSGASADKALLKLFPTMPAVNAFCTDSVGNLLNRLTDDLFIIISKPDNAPALWQALASDLQQVGLPWWQLQLIRAGQATLTSALSEQLVPQMLNLQATGAISFSKGCYTGQEVVARMQYLGKLKRRTYLLIATPSEHPFIPAPGDEIADSNGKPVGTVVQTAPSDANSIAMLAVLRESALEQSELLISGQTVSVTLADLPYEFTEQ